MPVEQTGLAMGCEHWMLGRSQFPTPMSPLVAEVYAPAYNATQEAEARMGGRPFYMGLRFIESWAYFGPIPIESTMSPEEAVGAAEAVVAGRLWEQAFAMWPEVRTQAIDANRAMQAIDPVGLDDAALAAHLRALLDHHGAMVGVHHLLTNSVLFAVAWFLMNVGEWTGLSPAEIVPVLTGASSVSRPDSPECRAAAAAAGAALLGADLDAAEHVRRLREIPAVAAFIDDIRCRVVSGFDLSSPRVEELPQLIVDRLRVAAAALGSPAAAPPDATWLRDLVPAEHRPAFDGALAGALVGNAIRDERGIVSDSWSLGLLRRGLQEAGRRLVDRGVLDDWSSLAMASVSQAVNALTDRTFSRADLAERTAAHAAAAAEEPPMFIGSPPDMGADPNLPPAMATLERVVGTIVMTTLGGPPPMRDDGLIGGVGASAGTAEGTARVLAGPEEMDRLEPGDILVTATTTEAFNAAVHLVAAIVTDHGGVNSHAAIISREAGIPAVVGCGFATAAILDGARIRVDGDAGTVTIVG